VDGCLPPPRACECAQVYEPRCGFTGARVCVHRCVCTGEGMHWAYVPKCVCVCVQICECVRRCVSYQDVDECVPGSECSGVAGMCQGVFAHVCMNVL
jgi:hypothetical protein